MRVKWSVGSSADKLYSCLCLVLPTILNKILIGAHLSMPMPGVKPFGNTCLALMLILALLIYSSYTAQAPLSTSGRASWRRWAGSVPSSIRGTP